MFMFVNYFKLKHYIKDLGYDDYEVKETIKSIRKMDKEIKNSFLLWFNKGILPDYEIENFNMQELTEKIKMNEINAFLYMDWLKKEPRIAKKALSKPVDTIVISDELKAKLEAKIGKKDTAEEIEDTSDIKEE